MFVRFPIDRIAESQYLKCLSITNDLNLQINVLYGKTNYILLNIKGILRKCFKLTV